MLSSILLLFPMILLYEIMSFVQYMGIEYRIRNGADVFFRQLFSGLGVYSFAAYNITLLFILFAIIYINREIIYVLKLKISYLSIMLIESIIWSTLFILIMGVFEDTLLSIFENNILLSQYCLAIGAGIWEELLFRVLAFTIVTVIIKDLIGQNSFFANIIAIIISALLFAIFHYVGQFGEIFTYRSLYIRTFAGCILGILYVFRGFGITAYTHIFYNLVILTVPVLKNN